MCNKYWIFVASYLICSVLSTPLDPVPIGRGFVLSEYVRHWEAVRYVGGARRLRRGAPAPAPGPLRLSFKAHSREFHLRLRPDPGSVFAEGAEFHSSRGPVQFQTGNVYSGTLEDDESSSVHGVITSDGLFDGTISTLQEDFYVEPLHRYGKTHPQIHSIIYKTSDVIHPKINSTESCASHLLYLSEKRKNSLERAPSEKHSSIKHTFDFDSDFNNLKVVERVKRWLPEDDNIDVFRLADIGYEDDENYEDRMIQDEAVEVPLRNPSLPIDLFVPYYSESEDTNPESNLNQIRRNKTRGVLINNYDDSMDDFSNPNSKNHVEIKTKNNANIIVKADVTNKKPVGYTHVSSLLGNVTDSALRHVNKRATIDPKKTTCMLYLQADHQFYQKFGSEEACIEVMTRHVQRVNAIYRVTDFNQDGKADNITFMIKRIKVHTMEALKDPLYRFPNNYGVEKFLELFSEEDYDGFCLAYMFTYRDFEMGTLGLAWTGDLKNAGGVCEKNGHYRGSLKSLNTGIVTLLNYGKHVPPAVSHVTLAHEIGHNFGSPHDPEVCTPGGEDGNFIMFARATSGDKKNNNHFSPCSLKSINPVLNNKARSSKGCFTEPQVSLCGNGVVEAGEECDCGWEGDCREPCCHPQRRHPPPGETPCRLTPHSICSPSQGPCCTAQCSLRFGSICRSDNGCRDASHCDGRRPHCPPSASKPNKTVCDDGFVCYMGECTGSICLAYGLESCQCSAERACELCCKQPGPASPCRSSFLWNQPPYDVPDMFAKPGTPCNDYNGYCDVFQKCREVDPSGPLATLRKLLLSEESISGFKRWVWEHWYAVAAIIIAVIALLVGSTRLLGKKPDGKLKSVTIIHSSTTETVRLPEHCPEGVIIHTAVRSKVPLKKKVALKTRVHRKPKDKTPTDSTNNNNNNKNGKNKKRMLAPLVTTAEDAHKHISNKEATSSHIEAVAMKLKKKHKTVIARRKNKKEVIDYSAAQKERDPNAPTTAPVIVEADSVGKVQNWLLNSTQSSSIPKSKSTPVGLADRSPGNVNKPGSKPLRNRQDKNSKSVNNLSQGEKDKMRLQVIYKPPFKFSLKLCKSDKTRVVLDKTSHSRAKKKTHGRTVKADEAANRLSKTINPVLVPLNDVAKPQAVSQLSQLSNTATVGLNQGTEASPYEQISSSNDFTRPEEHRTSQYRKMAPILTHRKSNSVGQSSQLAESRQNLLLQDQLLGSGSSHFYENMMFNSGSGNENMGNEKSSSMPRNISPRQKSRAVTRQSSHNAALQGRTSNSQRQQPGQRLLHNSLTGHIKKSYSNASQRNSLNMQKGSSLNNLHLPMRMNSVSDKKRHSVTTEPTYCNVERSHSKVGSGEAGMSRSRLKRQLSANELFKSPTRPDLFVPQSAGANYADAHRAEFDWMQNKGKSADRKVLNVQANDADCNKSQSVPNNQDANLDTHHRRSKNQNSHRRQQAPLDSNAVAGFSGSSDSRPVMFGELKNSLPLSNVEDPSVYHSDMEVLVSDNDYSMYDV